MRYKPEHKQATRDRIAAAAARLFREGGYEGTGVDAIMAEAGLTPGAFYAHFASKEALLVEALSRSLDESTKRVTRAAASSDNPFGALVGRYLCESHRDDPGAGCPLPCLTAEVARMKPAPRKAFTRALARYLSQVESCVPGNTTSQRRERVLATLSTLVGAMTLARAVSDKSLSDEIFDSARHALLSPGTSRPAASKKKRSVPDAPRAVKNSGLSARTRSVLR